MLTPSYRGSSQFSSLSQSRTASLKRRMHSRSLDRWYSLLGVCLFWAAQGLASLSSAAVPRCRTLSAMRRPPRRRSRGEEEAEPGWERERMVCRYCG